MRSHELITRFALPKVPHLITIGIYPDLSAIDCSRRRYDRPMNRTAATVKGNIDPCSGLVPVDQSNPGSGGRGELKLLMEDRDRISL